MVLKKLILYFIFFSFVLSKTIHASRILDYETEVFIDDILNEIKLVNNIERDIKFIILADEKINAFVDQNNIIYITSGLIENCEDYVAFLSVIAHEVGHIHNNHIAQRKLSMNKVKNINAVSNLSIIVGSMMANNPQILQGLSVSSASVSEFYINFTKNQEREADYYAMKTLSELNLYSNSIIKLLNTIEQRGIERGLSKNEMRLSTHPYFEERIDIVNYLKKKSNPSYNYLTNENFKFIQAKFIGYSENSKRLAKINQPYNIYSQSIIDAKRGNLKNSLENLNYLISTNDDNIYLIETKGEILFSYGYINEAIKFYKLVLNKLPNNRYAQIRIFENTNFEELSSKDADKLFYENLNILEKYYNNKNILLTYLKLSTYLKKDEWIIFLNYWLNKNLDRNDIVKNLDNFMDTNDKYLLKLIKLMYNNI